MKTRTLRLPLKKKWYDMIKRGEKKEEYRKVTPYWCKRLVFFTKAEFPTPTWQHVSKWINERCFIPLNMYHRYYVEVEFTLGYPKKDDTSRRMKFAIENISVGQGKPKWGAEPGELYFVIELGGRIS